MNSPESYIPILIQIGVAVGFVVLTLSLSHLLGPNRKTKQREENFECGIESQGNARFPVSVKYFLSAILFTTDGDKMMKLNKKGVATISEQPATFKNADPILLEYLSNR